MRIPEEDAKINIIGSLILLELCKKSMTPELVKLCKNLSEIGQKRAEILKDMSLTGFKESDHGRKIKSS